MLTGSELVPLANCPGDINAAVVAQHVATSASSKPPLQCESANIQTGRTGDPLPRTRDGIRPGHTGACVGTPAWRRAPLLVGRAEMLWLVAFLVAAAASCYVSCKKMKNICGSRDIHHDVELFVCVCIYP